MQCQTRLIGSRTRRRFSLKTSWKSQCKWMRCVRVHVLHRVAHTHTHTTVCDVPIAARQNRRIHGVAQDVGSHRDPLTGRDRAPLTRGCTPHVVAYIRAMSHVCMYVCSHVCMGYRVIIVCACVCLCAPCIIDSCAGGRVGGLCEDALVAHVA